MKMLPVEKIAKLMQDNDAGAIMEEMRIFREEERRKLEDSLCEVTGWAKEDALLLVKFAKAAGNLYGVISLGDFYRIVRELAPELKIEEETFLSFMRVLDGEEYLYVIEHEKLDCAPETITMECELVAEWVDCDYDNAYETLCERHASCPRYVPEREEFLRYEDEFYFEENPAKQKMRGFLMEHCNLKGDDLEDWLDQVLVGLHLATDLTPEVLLKDSVNCYSMRPDIFRQIYSHSQEFAECIGELYENMRFVYTNAYTLAELRKMQTVANIEVEPTVDFSEYELLPEYKSKVGRNDSCPCGSGKKYKKCCGRGK